jgi:hypothetical protein
MKIELCICKDRVPYIVDEFGADRVTVSEYSGYQDLITFEVDSQLDFLYMFHAGIRCGSKTMSEAIKSAVF